jgi:hypothetical protein
MTDKDPTVPNAETRAAESSESRAAHRADRPATPDEEKAAPGRESLDSETKKKFEEMSELGANVKGEGELP